MKYRFSISFLLFLCLHFTAEAQSKRNVAVKNFNSLSVSSGIDLYLTQAQSESLSIEGQQSAIDDIIVEQTGSAIRIHYKSKINWNILRSAPIKVYVHYKTLARLAASGGSDVFTQNLMRSQSLDVQASGGSDMNLNLVCKNLHLELSGGADVTLKGRSENLSLSASGGADVKAYSLITDYAKVAVSGGSDAYIYVQKGLDARASGGGDIHYKGNAVLKNTNPSHSGDIIHVK